MTGAEDRDLAAEAAEIARLAALDAIAYDREREAAAGALGVRVGTLDALVAAAQPKPEAPLGRAVGLPAAEPWPDAVGGAEVLDALAAILRHVILLPPAVDGSTLWFVDNWVVDGLQQ